MTSLIHPCPKRALIPLKFEVISIMTFFKVAQSYPHGPKLAQLTVSGSSQIIGQKIWLQIEGRRCPSFPNSCLAIYWFQRRQRPRRICDFEAAREDRPKGLEWDRTRLMAVFLPLSLRFSSVSPRWSRAIPLLRVLGPTFSCLATWTWVRPPFTTLTAR